MRTIALQTAFKMLIIGKDFLILAGGAGQRQYRSPKTKRDDIRFHGDVLKKR
ncbi:hypothetical protein [Agrobacterium rubi]|uniref:Uncharacterized protein n=2 Tax=Agrobacterium rubi TaxID=28099 RepID=A0AAE7R5M1_9HYPH|nr:hypothetical protein [Agrobacterium rubi]MBP1879110.1 hypothetical protein [Agrobacterium rubi]NTE85370.1 hypothetical protein [Agrobacterium rubi]NTF01302.1 hypothetical protein [Agrobacterium rubi]NTF06426.1 hypothetical protein [Agrobacterium rubi]NTF18668.1 hypothetical protein [Agrobacterium rubi]